MPGTKTGRKIKHTSLGWRRDQQKRSQQPWERGIHAGRKGNPSYRARVVKDKNGRSRKVYVLAPGLKR